MLRKRSTSGTRDKDSIRRWRFYALLALCAALPLVLFLYAADRFLRRWETRNLLQQSEQAADVLGKLLEQKLAETAAPLRALASDPTLLEEWKRHDGQALLQELRQARELRAEAAFFAIYNAQGSLEAIYPASPQAAAGAPPDWVAAALNKPDFYIAGATPLVIAPHSPAITVAAPLKHAQPAGFLVAAYPLEVIQDWVKGTSAVKWITIVDQKGTIVANSGVSAGPPGTSIAGQADVNKVLAGQKGTEYVWREGKRFLVSRYPLSSAGWGLLVEIPGTEIDKAIWQFERPIALLGSIFIVLAVGLGAAGALLYRRLRASEENIRQIITTSTDAFIAIDQDGRVTEWNPRAEILFGWSRDEVIGQPLDGIIIPERYRAEHRRGLEQFRATGSAPVVGQRLELSAMRRNQEEFPVELSIGLVRKGRSNSFNAFLRDITERRRAQQQISSLNLELRDRIADLEARNNELEAFSYSVSHDVRAPLRHISGFTQALEEACGQQINAEGREYLARIQASSRRMQRLVDDLLRFSRLGEHGLQRGLTDLNELVAEVIAGLRQDVVGRDVNFEVEKLPSVECDAGLVRQVFWNLLSNALKFTRTRRRAVISVGESRQNGQPAFFVRDNGVGFDMKYAGHLFGVFQRLHREEEFEGSGVGLATVKRIILKHRGRIWASSEPDQGTTFFFTLGPEASLEALAIDEKTTSKAK